jgi:hypothetical protein
MVGAVRFELTTSCTPSKKQGVFVIAHNYLSSNLPANQITALPALLQAFSGVYGQLAVEKAVSGCVRIWAVSELCHCRILCRGCVTKPVQPIKARPAMSGDVRQASWRVSASWPQLVGDGDGATGGDRAMGKGISFAGQPSPPRGHPAPATTARRVPRARAVFREWAAGRLKSEIRAGWLTQRPQQILRMHRMHRRKIGFVEGQQ